MIEVPFIENESPTLCAQVSIQGLLRYFDSREWPTLDQIVEASGKVEGSNTLTSQLALALDAYGLLTTFFTDGSEPDEITKKEVLKKVETDERDRCYKEASKRGLLKIHTPTLGTLRSSVDAGNPMICLIDFNKLHERVYGRTYDYAGHFVTIVGIDDNNTYIHQSGPYQPKSSMPINNDLFLDAFNSTGTFHDAVIVSGWKDSTQKMRTR